MNRDQRILNCFSKHVPKPAKLEAMRQRHLDALDKFRQTLIDQRNELVDKPFYLLRFWLHDKVKELDKKIDSIDQVRNRMIRGK